MLAIRMRRTVIGLMAIIVIAGAAVWQIAASIRTGQRVIPVRHLPGGQMTTQREFTGRKEHREGHRVHFAEVTVRAGPCPGGSHVLLSENVLIKLREVFGVDFEHQRHCVWSAVSAQIATINVAGEMPLAGAASFRAEVVDVRVSGNAGREISGFLLSMASMNAIADYLEAWENEQRIR
jgi:hypothetical protein